MGVVIVSWRIIYNHILMTRQLDQKITIIGSGPSAKTIAKEIAERVDTGLEVIGFITGPSEKVAGLNKDPPLRWGLRKRGWKDMRSSIS